MEFIESKSFDSVRENYFDDDEFQQFQEWLMANPESGDRIKGSGGIRMVRWSVKGKGKRGGVRVIYYYIVPQSQLLLMTMYRKNELSDLTQKEIRILRDIVKAFR